MSVSPDPQITEAFPEAQVETTHDPDNYSRVHQNTAPPNEAGKGNVGGQADKWLDSSGNIIVTIDDRGLLSSRSFLGVTGELKFFPIALSVTQDQFLLCNGAAVSRTTYANLFALIGTSFGVGDGSTTFNLPNYSDVVFGARGTLFNDPTSTFGSNSDLSLSHNHNYSHTHGGATNNSTPFNTGEESGAQTGDSSAGTTSEPSSSRGVTDDGTSQQDVGATNHTHTTGPHNHSIPNHDHSVGAHSHGINAPGTPITSDALTSGQTRIQATRGVWVYIKT